MLVGFANCWGDLAFPAAAFALGVNLLAAVGFGMGGHPGIMAAADHFIDVAVGAAVRQMREPGEFQAVKAGSGEGIHLFDFQLGKSTAPWTMCW